MADIKTIATAFTQFYYNAFDADRSQLKGLYREDSMLTWESEQFLGSQNIVNKLVGLPFSKVAHKVETVDPQPSRTGEQSMIVLVTGKLMVDDGQHPLLYTQAFQLMPDGTGNYYVLNDVFRLVYS